MATLRDYFDTDFSSDLSVVKTIRFTYVSPPTDVISRVHYDFTSHARYVSCYVPASDLPLQMCKQLITGAEGILSSSLAVGVMSGFGIDKATDGKDLSFTRKLYLYLESEMLAADLEQLESTASNADIILSVRGDAYVKKRAEYERPLAFISHDSRDKDSIARPIAVGLSRLGCTVWFDEFSLKVGDRLRESIEKGLKECKKCVLILSRDFLSNPGWTKEEFNSLFTRELIEKSDIILPVWHDVSQGDVYDYSPALANRVALKWEEGGEAVIRKLCQAVRN